MEEKVQAIIDLLKQRYPESQCALHYEKDYELMISVRLSAQCTDARVNQVTPALFAEFPTLEAMASAPIERVEELVRSCGFYKHKARDHHVRDLLSIRGRLQSRIYTKLTPDGATERTAYEVSALEAWFPEPEE